MKIEYFANLRDITGCHSENWAQPAATVKDLLRALSDHYGPCFRQWFYHGETPAPYCIILVNGQDSRHVGGLDTPLKPDDTIGLFPPVAGGAAGHGVHLGEG